jgi:hypothetical protein
VILDLPGGLAAVSWRDRQKGIEEERPIGHVFLFVGAEPETGWLEGCGVALDSRGFGLTGQPTAGRPAGHLPAPLESSVAGVFAVGDVRPGSVKRVGVRDRRRCCRRGTDPSVSGGASSSADGDYDLGRVTVVKGGTEWLRMANANHLGEKESLYLDDLLHVGRQTSFD